MPIDDDDDGALGQPLPPEDRLWRHPSEVNAPGAPQPIVLVAKTVGWGRVVAAAVLAGMLGAASTLAVLSRTDTLDEREEAGTVIERIDADLSPTPGESTLAIASDVLPSVARVETTGPGGTTTGTAVVFRDDGHLVTTADVVDGAELIVVILDDGSQLGATFVGRDIESDVAVIKVEQVGLPPAVGDLSPQELTFGDPTVVIDFGSNPTRAPDIAEGFLSTVSRQVDRENDRPLFGLIQTNTPASFGASSPGSVLVNDSGEVVGIVTGRAGGDRGDDVEVPGDAASQAAADGLVPQFATPADYVWKIAGELIDTGEVRHPLLGVDGETVTGEEAQRLDVVGGMRIDSLLADGPAEKAGLQEGDVIVAIDGTAVGSLNDLVTAIRRKTPGQSVSITYLRETEKDVALATLQEWTPNVP
ncbi:MAG: S1C family serine protease [Acidimicrobiales bacterium]|nr:S1C family serine protease [Acidimicrobiales bacterium]